MPPDAGNGNEGAGGTGNAGDQSVTLVDGQGNFAENWRDNLPEDIRDHPELKNVKNFNALVKNHVNLQGRLGKSIQLPKEDASDDEKAEAMAAIYTKLGRPEGPDGYEVTRPQLPDGMQYDEGVEKSARELAHKLGWNQQQFAAAYEWFNNVQAAQHSSIVKEVDGMIDNAEKKLREKFPEDEQYKGVLEVARRAYDMYGGDDFATLMQTMGLNNNPVIVSTFFEIYRQHHADELVSGFPALGTQTTPGVLSYPNTPD